MAKLNSGTRIFGTANVDSTLVVGSVSPQSPTTSSNNGTLQVGSGLTFSDTGIIASFQSNTNSYSQIVNQNSNTGTLSSSDFIVSNDNAGSTIYGDFGINSTIANNPSDPFSDANGTYLYAAGGSLTEGTLNAFDYKIATNNIVRLTANGTTGNIAIANNLIVSNTTTSTSNTTGALIVAGGLGVASNIYANFVSVGTDMAVGGAINTGIIGTSNRISATTRIASNVNAQSYGPTTIAAGASVFVPVTSNYKIITY